ncbi:hypothetical protein Sdel_1091 [Sulfurospirillum deleyianum DSM 6946]|uniref:YhdP central domain-containing protein n=2 Tax=Sulfurospirillum deleyianum TaxID=65553 RepID=D1B1Z5_SULD5|nr:hypothetical protein Sdel_1091 [Sulfurospirillum deleyianum DSM 6946]
MIIKAISHSIRNIWKFVLFMALFFVVLIGTLMYGVTIESITLPKVKIDQLYIKLDKKFIVSIQTLELDTHTQTDTSLEESAIVLENFPYLDQFFSQIHIHNLLYDNEHITLHYEENHFRLTSQHLDVDVAITPLSKTELTLHISKAYLKDFFLHVNGEAHLDLKEEHYTFEGFYETFGLKGSTLLELKKNLLSYHLQSEPFSNVELSNFMDFLAPKVELEQIVKDWIHTNIVGKNYVLHFLEGILDIQTGEYFPMQMRGHATVQEATIIFEKSVPPAYAKEIGITLTEDKLLFDISAPEYEQKSIEKADVFIYNLLTKGTGIVVDLKTHAKLDASIHKILHAFKIDVPLTQTSGKTDAHVTLDIKFLPYDINASGTFKLSPSHFNLSGVPMSTRSGEVSFHNYFVNLNRANLRYKNLFDIDATGDFDTKKSRFNGFVDIHSLMLEFGKAQLLNAQKLPRQEASFSIENGTTTMLLPELNTTILFEPKKNQFILEDLSKVASISPLMLDNGLKEGNVSVTTDDFEHFNARLHLYEVSTPFKNQEEPIKALDIALSTDTHTLDAHTLDYTLALHVSDEIILHVKDLDLLVPQSSASLNIPIKTTLYGENSSILDENSSRTILSDRYTLMLFQNKVHLEAKKDEGSFVYQKRGDMLNIDAHAMNDAMINALFNRHYFHKGSFDLTLEPKTAQIQTGVFKMHNTYIKDLKFFNNLMATINTIPSLLVFNDPNFSQQGYFVENGSIVFEQTKETLLIKEIQLRGKNADIVGFGNVNLTNDTLNMQLNIKTLKTFSQALDMIPLVGGLILGEDKRISTHVDVTGTLSDPSIETHLLLDTLKSPVNILKRTLEAPLELLK